MLMSDRIEQVPVTDLAAFHRNPRRGDVDKIRESLETNGQFRPLVVNKGSLTGRPNEVLAGNHTLAAAIAAGWERIAVLHVDVDDEACTRIVTADNRLSDLATYDDSTLLQLLRELPDLDGTGYDLFDLDELADSVDPPTGGGHGFGEPVVSYLLVFDGEKQQEDWFTFLRWLRELPVEGDVSLTGRLMAMLREDHPGVFG